MRKKRLNKKGMTNETFMLILDVAVAFFFFMAIFGFVRSVKDNTIFEKNYLTRDISLMIETVIASPHLLNYEYPENITNFTIGISENTVRVWDLGEEATVPNRYWYAIEIDNDIEYGPENNDQLFFAKEEALEING